MGVRAKGKSARGHRERLVEGEYNTYNKINNRQYLFKLLKANYICVELKEDLEDLLTSKGPLEIFPRRLWEVLLVRVRIRQDII